MKSWREKAISGIRPGDTFVFSRKFTRKDIVAFGGVSRDYNPVHYDALFAGTRGFKGVICHGLLVGGLVCEWGGQVAWLASGLRFSFLRPVYAGDTVTCTIKVLSASEKRFARASVRMVNQDGLEVLRAVLEGLLPGERQTRRLAKISSWGARTPRLGARPGGRPRPRPGGRSLRPR